MTTLMQIFFPDFITTFAMLRCIFCACKFLLFRIFCSRCHTGTAENLSEQNMAFKVLFLRSERYHTDVYYCDHKTVVSNRFRFFGSSSMRGFYDKPEKRTVSIDE